MTSNAHSEVNRSHKQTNSTAVLPNNISVENALKEIKPSSSQQSSDINFDNTIKSASLKALPERLK
jgi:hypothetical protein